jgi:hypothetical protein
MGILFWEALIGLLLYDLLLFGRSFRRMRRFVMKWKIAKCRAVPDVIAQVCKAVNYAGVWYPKRVLCLQRSAVTTCLLRRQGVPAQMVTGAQKAPFKAHAWTEVNGRAINERRNVQAIYGVWERC